jgi:hypothetical protein
MESWRDYIEIGQLPEDYRMIAGVIGLDNTIKLAYALPSIYVYLLSPDKLFKPAKVKYILDRYARACPEKPFIHRRIALETGLSIREIYDIIAARKEESKQQQLFADA